MKKGAFVVLEGCEGTGKSTQLKLLSDFLEVRGIAARFTREPGGHPVSEKIRHLILDVQSTGMTGLCELLLYAAARAQHVSGLIAPALESGKWVICDRFVDSTIAYQGVARGLDIEIIKMLNKISCGEIRPDIVLFLDFPPDKAFLRKGGRDERDRLEREGIEFHKRVYEGYALAERMSEGIFVRIDASGTKQETHRKIIAALVAKGIICS